MNFEELKKVCENKPIEKLVNLPIGKKFIISKLERKNTSVGVTVLADLLEGDISVWLPKRFLNTFSEEAIKDFNENYSNQLYLEVKEIRTIMGRNSAIIKIEKC